MTSSAGGLRRVRAPGDVPRPASGTILAFQRKPLMPPCFLALGELAARAGAKASRAIKSYIPFALLRENTRFPPTRRSSYRSETPKARSPRPQAASRHLAFKLVIHGHGQAMFMATGCAGSGGCEFAALAVINDAWRLMCNARRGTPNGTRHQTCVVGNRLKR